MNWQSIQQFLRIIIYAAGGYLVGDGVAEGAEFQAAAGGVVSIIAFVWWYFWERNRT